MIRPPAVAGRFYPGTAADLTRQVAALCASSSEPDKLPRHRRAIACIVPHAGYRYSGHVAGAVYAQIDFPRCILVLGPRHRPRGEAQAILSSGGWQTPLGVARIDSDLAAALMRACPALTEDAVAHAQEHSLEVQVPFLQHLAGD